MQVRQADALNYSLEEALNKFQQLAGSDPVKMYHTIPAKEMWRFFVDGVHQKQVRGLSENRYPALEEYRKLTIREYLENHDDDFRESANKNICSSELYAVLESYRLNVAMDEVSALGCWDKVTIDDLLLLDTAWMAYEVSEPGYLLAMQAAMHFGMTLTSTFTVDHILQLHRLCGSGVKGTNYDAIPKEVMGEFRKMPGSGYQLDVGGNVTEAGLEQLLRNMQPYQYLCIYFLDFNFSEITDYGILHFNTSVIEEILQNPGSVKGYARYSDNQRVKEFNPNHPIDASFIRFKEIIIEKSNKGENIAKWFFSILNSPFFSLFDGEEREKEDIILSIEYRTLLLSDDVLIESIDNEKMLQEAGDASHMLREKMEDLLVGFNVDLIRAQSPQARLQAIVEYLQSCDQLHAFSDFNCRVLCVQLLLNLLRLNNLPPSILDDPNHFDLYSKQELYDEVVRGMHRVFELIERDELYGVKTDYVLSDMQSSPLLAQYLDKFKQFVSNEERFRRVVSSLHQKSFRLVHLSHFAIQVPNRNKTCEEIPSNRLGH